jgi:DNA-binding Lrp family transcriptional regulator
MMSDSVLSATDQRLIAALQCDGRLTVERAAEVLDLPARVVRRGWAALLAGGDIRVVAARPRPALHGTMLLRVRVLRGRVDAVARALAARDDIPLVELSASGDQVIAVLVARPDDRDRLVFRQLPQTTAVTAIDAQTVLHVYADATDWRLDVLTDEERRALTRQVRADPAAGHVPDDADRAIAEDLAADARRPAAAVARATGLPESTIRRRLTALLDLGRLSTTVLVEPRRLGLGVDADLRLQVSPARLDETGRALAAHPAVHGALATTGPASLLIAVWLADLDHLYRFLTRDLAGLGIGHVDTMIIGEQVKRPAGSW